MASGKKSPEMSLPNFRWIIPGILAASAIPQSITGIKRARINTVVSFITRSEEEDLGPQIYSKRGNTDAKAYGIVFHRFYIPDLGIPNRKQLRDFFRIMERAEKNRVPVLIHCILGIGRTGTMAAAYLIARKKLPLEHAHAIIRKGLEKVFIDTVKKNKDVSEKLKTQGISLEEFAASAVRFPESPRQQQFLERIEKTHNQWIRKTLQKKILPSALSWRMQKRKKNLR